MEPSPRASARRRSLLFARAGTFGPLPLLFALLYSLLLLLIGLPSDARAADPDFSALARAEAERLTSDRRWLHAHPELSLRETATRAWLKEQLGSIPGITWIEGDWGNGLVALMKGGLPGPLVAYRADFDALPIQEATGLPFASTVTDTLGGRTVGVMHACGHDLHSAILLGVARTLSQVRSRMPGSVLFLLEPAEEVGAGAEALVAGGALEKAGRPVAIFALHDHPTLLTGQVGYCPGRSAANVDDFRIRVLGRGGHGAYPHKTVDPVVIACQMVIAFQSIVSREVEASRTAVLTVGEIHGGSTSNIIPDEVELHGTVRTLEPEVRAQMQQAVSRTALGIAEAFGAPEPVVAYQLGTPSMYNDPPLVEEMLPVLRGAVGDTNVVRYEPAMGGEDFSVYSAVIPGFMFRLGVGRPGRTMTTHSATFDPDESAMPLGVRLICEMLWARLSNPEAKSGRL